MAKVCRKTDVIYTAVVPLEAVKATLEAEEILESYCSFEDTEPGEDDGPALPPGRLEHEHHLRQMEIFQKQLEQLKQDPTKFLEHGH